ncbi:hypothetical protein F5051DRAFT_332345, partial [Lentinula edodes]
GEEDKNVQSELRGVELFVKRGSNDYPSGILGQVKYWSDKKTLVERLLFRREPLRKVSMNIRLQPAVRCTFDPQECILRLLRAESSESKASGTTGIVVYALKPGRFCSRKDFQTFSEFVIGNSSLKTAIVLRRRKTCVCVCVDTHTMARDVVADSKIMDIALEEITTSQLQMCYNSCHDELSVWSSEAYESFLQLPI